VLQGVLTAHRTRSLLLPSLQRDAAVVRIQAVMRGTGSRRFARNASAAARIQAVLVGARARQQVRSTLSAELMQGRLTGAQARKQVFLLQRDTERDTSAQAIQGALSGAVGRRYVAEMQLAMGREVAAGLVDAAVSAAVEEAVAESKVAVAEAEAAQELWHSRASDAEAECHAAEQQRLRCVEEAAIADQIARAAEERAALFEAEAAGARPTTEAALQQHREVVEELRHLQEGLRSVVNMDAAAWQQQSKLSPPCMMTQAEMELAWTRGELDRLCGQRASQTSSPSAISAAWGEQGASSEQYPREHNPSTLQDFVAPHFGLQNTLITATDKYIPSPIRTSSTSAVPPTLSSSISAMRSLRAQEQSTPLSLPDEFAEIEKQLHCFQHVLDCDEGRYRRHI